MVAMLNRRSLLSIFACLSLVVSTSLFSSTAFAAPIAPPKSKGTVDMAQVLASDPERDMAEGDKNAPVTIVEYASVTCSHCADFYLNTMPAIREKYIKTGQVRFIFREFAFDPRATAGFMLARCLPEDRYFPFIQVLFEKQMEWAGGADALTPLQHLASMAGITQNGFNACLQNKTLLDGVNASLEAGKKLGVSATPTFFINGHEYEGALPVDQMSAVIDSYL